MKWQLFLTLLKIIHSTNHKHKTMAEDRAFYFNYQIYSKNAWLNDTNVYMYEFVNLSIAEVTLNNQLTLKAGTNLSRFKEDIQAGEKTATQYYIKFADETDPTNSLLVITKIPVNLPPPTKK